jgi:hypothetical protein
MQPEPLPGGELIDSAVSCIACYFGTPVDGRSRLNHQQQGRLFLIPVFAGVCFEKIGSG